MKRLSSIALRSAATVAAALSSLALAAPDAASPYRADPQSSHVEDATSKGVQQVNMITCFMSAMRPDAMVNKGNYVALVDEKKCDPESRSDSGNSGSGSAGSNAPSYVNATVDATRSSNSEPMRAKIWVNEGQSDFSSTIYVNISATEAPSSSNPYGVFRLDYCGKGDTGPCVNRGYLEGSASGIDYFETETQGGGGGGPQSKALRLTTSGADSGAGSLQLTENGLPLAYSFAYNADFFRRSDGTNDQCFSRDASDADTAMSVWRYGLYDANTGARVARNSGFPIEFSAAGKTYNGHIGYWGLWLPTDASGLLVNGTTVQRVQYNDNQPPTKTDYTLVKADGRLVKYSKRTRTLDAIDKIKFNTWIWNLNGFFAGAVADRQYEMYWDEAAGAFKVSGVIECANGRCETRDLPTEQTVAASYFAALGGMRGWSQSLGGELFIPLTGVSGAVSSSTQNVIYRTQDLVYPAAMPANLYCLRECPTAASMGAYFAQGSSAASPFVAASFNNFGPTATADVVAYTTDASNALLRDGANAGVVMTDAAALLSRPQYQNGVRTGRLFTSLADAQCVSDPSRYCDNQVDELDTFYQWETGPNPWNQFAAVKDAGGTLVAFDAPLQVGYNVPAGAAYGQYAGKAIVLQYGGFGDLWGVPGHCVSRITNDRVSCETPDSRYVPAFVIPFDEVLGRVNNGATPLLAKWLDREIRFARKDLAVCDVAGVTLGASLGLPTAAGLNDPSDPASPVYIGAQPVVTDPPRVIHGEIKY